MSYSEIDERVRFDDANTTKLALPPVNRRGAGGRACRLGRSRCQTCGPTHADLTAQKHHVVSRFSEAICGGRPVLGDW